MKTLTADKQPTPAELMRVEMQCTTAEVMDVTGLSEEEVNEMIFETAYLWLEQQGCNEAMQNNFASQPEFWGFWKKAWYEVDRLFLQAHYQYWFNNAREWYLQYHHVGGKCMNNNLITASYHSLIKTLAVKR